METRDLNEVLIPLTNRAIATLFREMGEIFTIAVPSVLDDVGVQVPKFTRGLDLSKVDTLRADGAPPQEIRSDFKFGDIELKNHALFEPIDRNRLIRLNKIQRSSESYIVNNLTDGLMYNMHAALSAEIFNDDNYDDGTATYYGIHALAGGREWDQAAGTNPPDDIKTLKTIYRTRQGTNPRYLVMSQDVIDLLQANHHYMAYWSDKVEPEITEVAIAKYLKVPEVINLSTLAGIDGNYTDFYTDVCMFATIEPVGNGIYLGDIIGNRSAFRFYFLDQNSTKIQIDPNSRTKPTPAEAIYNNRLILKFWEKWNEHGFAKNVYATCDWSLDVANKWGLARIDNLHT
jgi:hypothetical protein